MLLCKIYTTFLDKITCKYIMSLYVKSTVVIECLDLSFFMYEATYKKLLSRKDQFVKVGLYISQVTGIFWNPLLEGPLSIPEVCRFCPCCLLGFSPSPYTCSVYSNNTISSFFSPKLCRRMLRVTMRPTPAWEPCLLSLIGR